jgi:hypothetical protein
MKVNNITPTKPPQPQNNWWWWINRIKNWFRRHGNKFEEPNK